jgi:hypothetical protein
LSRTFGAPTDRPKWTWSGWVKKAAIAKSGGQCLIQADNTTTRTDFYFTATDELRYYDTVTTAVMQTTPIYRDPSAWMHIMCVADIANATAASKMKMYVNGVEVTAFSTDQRSSMGTTGHEINKSASAHIIGGWPRLSTEFLDGYLTEINFIDGQALTPSSFGETDSITGVWKPKAYSGTYGTNGFELNFSDNSNNTAATIGKDYSGNGNNWTPVSISVTAGATYDSMQDVPTLTSATAANYCVLNPLVSTDSSLTYASANLNVSGGGSTLATRCTMSTIAVTSGKWYAEMTVGTTNNGAYAGIIKPSNLGVSRDISWNYYDNLIYPSGSGFSGTAGSGDIIGIAYDADNGTVQFYKNGSTIGSQQTGATVGAQYGFYVEMGSGGQVQDWNFGQRPFSYTPPTGFVALNTYNLPTSTITNGAAYMAATLYTGTGASLTVANTVGSTSFQPDWVWVKRRDGAQSHQLYDVIRGITKAVYSNLSLGEATEANGLSAFTSSGFTVISDIGVNTSGGTYVGWNWKAGTSSSITVSQYSSGVPSIASTVSANTTAGFSIVEFNATGATATIGHGLGVTPSMIIVKDAATAGNWAVWHTSLTSTAYYLFMNTTAGQANTSAIWTGSPNLNTFGIGSWHTADRQIAYCFSAVAGYSAFGSYDGNNVADGSFVYLGFRPRFIMIKSTSASTEWVMIDTARSSYNLSETALYANREYSESTIGTVDDVDILSNGFKLRNNTGFVNASQTYIYAAFAENPFKYALAR